MSSIRPDVSVQLAEAGRGARHPGARRARSAAVRPVPRKPKLSIMVGGEEADFKEAKPILEAVG